MLVPRVRDWTADAGAREALDRIAADPAVAAVHEHPKGVDVRLADDWVAARGEALESGAPGPTPTPTSSPASATPSTSGARTRPRRSTSATSATWRSATRSPPALRVGGAKVENRSLICDVGRSMGEAMAGVVASGRADDDLASENGNGEKSDHFVGLCYAEYVAASRNGTGDGDDGAEDSVAREAALYEDKADELMMRVLAGDQRALELWSKTRAWVISGQRKTLSRLGVPFDKVIFESDFLPEVAELTNLGLRDGTLRRREDGMVFYPTDREELEEMPLVRSDGLPTQHMRALAYWSAAPELDDFTSLQVCGTEWVSHVTCRRQLLDVLATAPSNGHPNPVANGNGRGGPPTHDVFHGMVARSNEAVSSSKEGALLIDDLVEWADDRLLADPELAEVRSRHPQPERMAARIVLAFFLLQTTSKRVEFEPELLFEPERSLGWDIVAAQAPGAGRRRRTAGRRRRRRWRRRPRLPLRGGPVGALPPPPAERRRRARSRCRWPATSRTSPAGTGRRSARRGSTRWRRRSSTKASAASGWRRSDAHPARRQPRLLHLQRLPPAGGGLGGGADRGQQRRGQLARAVSLQVRRLRPLPGAGTAGTLARLRRLPGHPPLQRGAGAGDLPRPPGDRQPARRRRRRRAAADARPAQPRAPSRRPGSSPACRRTSPSSATTRSRSPGRSVPKATSSPGPTTAS